MRIDHPRVDHLAGGVHHRHFDPGAKAGIETHGGARSGGRGQQQIAQIARENFYGLILGVLPQPGAQIDRQRNLDARAPGPADAIHQPLVAGTTAGRDAKARRNGALISRFAIGLRLGGAFRLQREIEKILLLAAKQREDTMRRQFGQRLEEIEIIGEFCALLRLAVAEF